MLQVTGSRTTSSIVGEEPELLAQGLVRPAAAVPRPDHLQAGPRPTAMLNGLQVERVRPREHRRHDHGDPGAAAATSRARRSTSRSRRATPRRRTRSSTRRRRRSTTSSPGRRTRTRTTRRCTTSCASTTSTSWPSGPFGPGVLGYLPDTGLPEVQPRPRRRPRCARTRPQTGKDLSFTLSIPNDAASQASAAVVVGMMQKAGMKMTLKPEEQSQQINDVIAGSYQAAAWRNHPGFDPDTQWVWWHCTVPAAAAGVAGTPRRPNIGVPTADGTVGNNCDNLVNFSRFNDPEINKDLETGRTSTDPTVRKPGLRGPQQGVRQAGLEGVGLLVGVDGPVPDRRARHPRTEPPDRDVRRRHADRCRARTPVSRAAPTCRGSGSRSRSDRDTKTQANAARPYRSEGCEQHYGV